MLIYGCPFLPPQKEIPRPMNMHSNADLGVQHVTDISLFRQIQVMVLLCQILLRFTCIHTHTRTHVWHVLPSLFCTYLVVPLGLAVCGGRRLSEKLDVGIQVVKASSPNDFDVSFLPDF